MIVNKSMYPLQTGFGVISKMQDRFATLQMQLGTGEKASTLSEMGRDLPLSLSVRARLTKIEGYAANIETVNLRMSFLDNAVTRFGKIESEARNSAVQGQYGTNNINMATIPTQSRARLDEVVTMLNSDVAGRYLFGGSQLDTAPVPDTTTLLEGQGGKAGFKTVVTERNAADLGTSGQGRLEVQHTAGSSSVAVAEDGVHPFGFKLSNISTASSGVSVTQPAAAGGALGDQVGVSFGDAPNGVQSGQTITMGFTLPDGTETQLTMKAVTASEYTGGADQFVIDPSDAAATAANFSASLEKSFVGLGKTELTGASTFAASQNFFNGAGEPVLRVDTSQGADKATALRVASDADTVMWYGGQSPAVAAKGMGRLEIASSGTSVTLAETMPVSAAHGFEITGASSSGGAVASYTGGNPARVGVDLGGAVAANDSVTVSLRKPDGTSQSVTLTAVAGAAGPGQFTIGGTPEQTAANFSTALTASVTTAAAVAEGSARQSVGAQVDDSTRVNYGIEANEDGLLRLTRSLAAMSVQTYPTEENILAQHESTRVAAMALPEGAGREAALASYQADLAASRSAATGRFDAMARRQQSELSTSHDGTKGSIEIITMELGIASAALESATERHTNYKAQLDNLLSDVETVSKEDVAMEILALQTRLQASYQVTSMVSQLSLTNYI